MKSVLVVAALGGVAAAGPVKPVELETTRHSLKLDGTNLDIFRVIAPTPTVSARIDTAIAADAEWLGAALRSGRQQQPFTRDVTCRSGVVTDRLVSWACKARYFDGHTGAGHVATGALRIEGDTTSEVTLATLFGANLGRVNALEGERSGNACKLEKAGLLIEAGGITSFGDSDMVGCSLSWEQLEPLLPPASAWMKEVIAAHVFDIDKRETIEKRDFTAAWSKAPQRFVAQADGVLDRATGLVWAAADNGKDVTWDEAVAFAKAYGGAKGNWRLPTEEELEVFAQPETAHREKGDCTGGTAQLLATPLVKLSCGLAWSSTKVDDKRAVGFGFLSGNPRISPVTERKNYRALVVRR